jgi:antitoxin Phd
LSSVIDAAAAGEPTVITRDGLRQAVLLSFDEYQRLSNVPSLGRLLAAFPGEAGDIPVRRRRAPRKVDL